MLECPEASIYKFTPLFRLLSLLQSCRCANSLYVFMALLPSCIARPYVYTTVYILLLYKLQNGDCQISPSVSCYRSKWVKKKQHFIHEESLIMYLYESFLQSLGASVELYIWGYEIFQ